MLTVYEVYATQPPPTDNKLPGIAGTALIGSERKGAPICPCLTTRR